MKRHLIRFVPALALTGAVVAPLAGHAAAPRAVTSATVTSTNFATTFPSRVAAGVFTLRLRTPGRDSTSVNIARLNAGVSQATIATMFHTGKVLPALSKVRLLGGVNSVGRTTQVGLFSLSAGTYVAFSLDQGTAQKNPHSPTAFFTVAGNSAAVPASRGTVTMVDFRFHVAATLPAGMVTLKLVNLGKSPHEMDVMRIGAGKTVADVKRAMMSNSQPGWAHEVGGWGTLSPGSVMYPRVDLSTPGNYILMCFVPDLFAYPGHKPTNKPHAMMGMITEFHVR